MRLRKGDFHSCIHLMHKYMSKNLNECVCMHKCTCMYVYMGTYVCKRIYVCIC